MKFWLPALLLAYLIIHGLQHYGIGAEAIRFHCKDLICIPLMLLAIDMLHQEWTFRLPNTYQRTFLAVVYVSIVFEWILPSLSQATGDMIDVACYMVGGLTYVMWKK